MRILETKAAALTVRIRRDVKTNEPKIVTQEVKSLTALRNLSRGNQLLYTPRITRYSLKFNVSISKALYATHLMLNY